MVLLEDILSAQPDFKLVGLYASAEEAIEKALWREADILLTDLELPGMAGTQLIIHAVRENPNLLPMVYTVHEDRETVFAALEAGAFGYVVKGSSVDQVVQAIRDLARGQSPISPAIARFLITAFRNERVPDSTQDLSPREAELLRLVAAGLSHKEIAAQLNISVHTVHAHQKNIYSKLHAANRQEALRRGRLLGYVGAPGTPVPAPPADKPQAGSERRAGS
ncbi:MAG: hypothetical protein RJA22_1543 [Verrucomicrobiota bacterium]